VFVFVIVDVVVVFMWVYCEEWVCVVVVLAWCFGDFDVVEEVAVEVFVIVVECWLVDGVLFNLGAWFIIIVICKVIDWLCWESKWDDKYREVECMVDDLLFELVGVVEDDWL